MSFKAKTIVIVQSQINLLSFSIIELSSNIYVIQLDNGISPYAKSKKKKN